MTRRPFSSALFPLLSRCSRWGMVVLLATTSLRPTVAQDTAAPSDILAPDVTLPSAVVPAPALPGLTDPVISAIEVRSAGSAVVDRNRVLSNMSLKIGGTYTPEKSDQDIKNLISSGVAANVNIVPEMVSSSSVRLIVIVEGRTNLGEVLFLGNTALSARTLELEVDLKLGTVVDDARLQEASTKIREAYQKKGFPDIDVRYQQDKLPDTGFTRVTFYITEGDRALLKSIRFDGNTIYTERELRKLVEVGDRDWWRVWNLTKRISSEKLEKDVAAIQKKYQDNGYMNAKVTSVDRVPNGDKVDVVFRISEGQKFDITAVGIEGMTTYPREELLPSLYLTAGEPYSAESINTDVKTIRDYYGARGYADVMVRPRINKSGATQLAVTYVVTENQRSYIRRINIDGNQKTKDEVIRRELAVLPGEEFNTTKLEISRRRLAGLGYFADQGGVDLFPVDTDTAGYKDVNITVQEKSTGNFTVGAGFSSIDNLIGILEVSQTNFDLWNWPNFTGAGQKFRSRIQYGTRRRDFSVEFQEPWFLGERLAFGTEFFYRDLYFLSDYFDQNVFGTSLSLTKPLGENTRLRGEYTLQHVSIDNFRWDSSPTLRLEEGDYVQSTLSGSFIYDTRRGDELFSVIRSGNKFQFDLGVSGLGGDVQTYDVGLSGATYFSFPFDTVLKLEGALESINEWGSDRVPIFQRKFLGGANNLRGFDYRDVGPRDENDEPLGGNTSAYFTAEYNFPLFWKFRGIVFADIGMVSSDFLDFGGDWNSDVGVGVHLYGIMPNAPIRIEVGFPVMSDDYNDNGARFNFNIGAKF